MGLSLYLNIPFCRSKCAFCDYVQAIPAGELISSEADPLRRNYIGALRREIELRAPQVAQKEVTSIYFGGGTASILSVAEFNPVFQALRDNFQLADDVETTMESSPDTLTQEKLANYKRHGFKRLSIGAQSFTDERLKSLGRRHHAQDIVDGVKMARSAGFDTINLDIMTGFPDELPGEVERNLDRLLACAPDHISVYSYRPTRGTAIRKLVDKGTREIFLSDQKRSFNRARSIVAQAGYAEYAIGYFGARSRFNRDYFQNRSEMLGIGSGAMSQYGGRFRIHTSGQIHRYIGDPVAYDVDIPLTAEPVVISNLKAGLSCIEGILRDEWAKLVGAPLDACLSDGAPSKILSYLRDRGLIEDEKGIRLAPEDCGEVFLDLTYQLTMAR